jgi:PhnB protein
VKAQMLNLAGRRQFCSQRSPIVSEAHEILRRHLTKSAISAAVLLALAVRSIADVTKKELKGNQMTTLTPYLLFDGNCRQAMEFYQHCFGGELAAAKVKDSPAKDRMPAFQQDKIVNARLVSGRVEISASDWLMPGQTAVRGNTVCLYLNGGTLQELKTLFDSLSEGADVTDPLSEQFFGAYGALNDRFGVRWMFHTDRKA